MCQNTSTICRVALGPLLNRPSPITIGNGACQCTTIGSSSSFSSLKAAQAGLSWITILKKRENYRKAFAGFRAEKIARYGARDVKRLLGDAGIVRNRLKIAATIQNAKMFLAVREEFGSFDVYLWSFVGGKPIQNHWRTMAAVPARTAESDAMSRDLLRRGFKFVGSTICYALMQATGMVNDHLVTCPQHAKLGGAPRRK
jgi:DNA-3-methyladenine glycosylase I